METGNNSTNQISELRDNMYDVSHNLEKILVVIDQLNDSYFERLDKPSIKALLSAINKQNNVPFTDEQNQSYNWIIDYERVQSFFEIIEDYIRESKNMLDDMRQEMRTDQAKGAA